MAIFEVFKTVNEHVCLKHVDHTVKSLVSLEDREQASSVEVQCVKYHSLL